MPEKQVSVGIVGLSRAGLHWNREPLRKHSGGRVPAVVDDGLGRCAEAVELTGCDAFVSLEAISSEVDVTLLVATPAPTETHGLIAGQVLAFG